MAQSRPRNKKHGRWVQIFNYKGKEGLGTGPEENRQVQFLKLHSTVSVIPKEREPAGNVRTGLLVFIAQVDHVVNPATVTPN